MKQKYNEHEDIEKLIEFVEIEIALGDLNEITESTFISAIKKIKEKFKIK